MHGLLVLYTTIAALYVYVLVYRPSYSYFIRGNRECTSERIMIGKRWRTRTRCHPRIMAAPVAIGAVAAAAASPDATSAPATDTAAPVTTTPAPAPPPPPTEPPMMTPATAPATTPEPVTAPPMNPTGTASQYEDESKVGPATESEYMAEYPPLF